jgi:hypothetical protein
MNLAISTFQQKLTSQHFLKWKYAIGGGLVIAFGLALMGRPGAPESSTNPLLKGTSKEWGTIAVQIEQLWSDGEWYPREPLMLDHGLKIQGHSAGAPDFEARMEPVYGVAGEPQSLYLARSITASCADGSSAISTVLHDASKADWEGRIECNEGIWRMKVVDAALVARPPVAKPGEMLPLLPRKE